MDLYHAALVREPINPFDIVEELRKSIGGSTGSFIVYIGVVKEILNNRKIKALMFIGDEREILEKIKEIIDEEKREGVNAIHVYHRIGLLEPRDTIMYIIVGADTRELAFTTARNILEKIKRDLLFLKKNLFEE